MGKVEMFEERVEMGSPGSCGALSEMGSGHAMLLFFCYIGLESGLICGL